jgi:hypothetical protein
MERPVRTIRPELRREARYHADIEGTLFCEGVGEPVTVLNISCYGALLATRYPPLVGSRVTLITESKELQAIVIWQRLDRCGILLSQPVDPLAMGVVYPVTAVTSSTVRALMT